MFDGFNIEKLDRWIFSNVFAHFINYDGRFQPWKFVKGPTISVNMCDVNEVCWKMKKALKIKSPSTEYVVPITWMQENDCDWIH